MIYITGDTHGNFKRIEKFCNKFETTREDIMIIVGDAGINYYEDCRDDILKEFLCNLPITIFCIHGNHEQRPESIDSYKEMEWKNGYVYVEDSYPNLLFAKDGEIYNLNEKQVLVLGGAYSIDKYYRLINGDKWFSNEQPSAETKHKVSKILCDINWNVDLVLSHTAPLKYEPTEVFLPMIDQNTVDKSTEEWLDRIEDNLNYEKWYCGHYHTEKTIDKIEFLYKNIKQLI